MQAETIRSPDGTAIALRSFEPAGGVQGSVVVGGAMGVRQDYYEPFARWMAQQGWRVTTFDYRGSGGHSLGAQLPGLIANQHKVCGLLSVAAGSGYWRDNAPQLKRIVPYFWFVLVPIAMWLFGYFPGRRLRKVGDLPAGVVMQWRKWCLNPHYSVGAEGEAVRQRYASAKFPVLALSITDDELMTLRGTHSLIDLYENAPREVRRIAPADLAVRRLGHFGPFRAEHQGELWPRMADWLRGLGTPAIA